MEVYIDKSVHSQIILFYEAAMRKHITGRMVHRSFVYMMFVIAYSTNRLDKTWSIH